MNRIKIQVILLILQLETDYFSSYLFQKCSIRSSGTTGFTETSRTAILHEEVLQDSSAPILQGYPHTYIIHQSTEFSIQNPILHPEDKELFEYHYYYIQRTKRPSFQKRNSMHRGQGDLLEIHPYVLQDLPKTFQTFQLFQTFLSFQTFQSFMTFQSFKAILQVPVSPGIPTHYSILQLEYIFYIFFRSYSLIGFHRKLHRVPVGQYKLQTLHSSKKGRSCDTSEMCIDKDVKMTYSPE